MLSGHLLGKSCLLGQSYVLFVLCLFIIIVVFHFGFEGTTLVLIAFVLGRRLPLTFRFCHLLC